MSCEKPRTRDRLAKPGCRVLVVRRAGLPRRLGKGNARRARLVAAPGSEITRRRVNVTLSRTVTNVVRCLQTGGKAMRTKPRAGVCVSGGRRYPPYGVGPFATNPLSYDALPAGACVVHPLLVGAILAQTLLMLPHAGCAVTLDVMSGGFVRQCAQGRRLTIQGNSRGRKLNDVRCVTSVDNG